jgi:hypothetical protein
MRIGLMIPNLTSHDAIGNDVNMYRAIKGIAIDAYVFTANGESMAAIPTYHHADVDWLCARTPKQGKTIHRTFREL